MIETVGIVGLGYVGLPVALGFGRCFPKVIGFDIDAGRIAELKRGADRTGEVEPGDLRASKVQWTDSAADLSDCTFYVITVPTPIDDDRQPDLGPLTSASEAVGAVLKKGAVVVYESTVYPGLTEEFCAPILERCSGLKQGVDFFVGYSPERINPGDKVHGLTNVVKVVAGENPATLERVATAYGAIIDAGVHRAPSIMVAEAAKVIENTQRDLNIALMNELSIIFDRMGIRTQDVLAAAGTKWNFLGFTPGLVGGHCIGVDPYYLTAKAERLGYHPEVILAGRRINDGMGAFVAQKLVKLLSNRDVPVGRARVGVLGLTFKENVPDLRNSRVPDIIRELKEFGIEVLVHDPLADAAHAEHEFGFALDPLESFQKLDAVVLAVSHQAYVEQVDDLLNRVVDGGVLVDVKSVVDLDKSPHGDRIQYWSL